MSKQYAYYNRLEKITRRWWFFAVFVLIQFIPPYASKGYTFPDEWSALSIMAMRDPIVSFTTYQPIFKIIPIVLVALILLIPQKISRLFSVYVFVSFVVFILRQSIGITEKYGLIIGSGLLTMFLITAVFWLWEIFINQNDLTMQKRPLWKYWVVPLAVLAFWYPLNRHTGMPDFNPVYLFTNCAGIAFCTMTPLYVGLLTLYYPKVNIPLLRVTSLVGVIIALYNMHLNFIVNPKVLWWNGILHIPLLTISAYGLIISFRTNTK